MLVTGAGSGLGHATALRLAHEGARVACADVDGDAADSVAALIGERALGLTVDVADEHAVAGAVSTVVDRWDRIDGLVANAAIRRGRSGLTMSLEEWNSVLAVNLTGTWLCLRAVLPAMMERGSGAVVVTSSLASLRGVGSAAYSASKGGLNALVRQMAVEAAPRAVRINAICPGPVLTPMVERSFAERAPDDPEAAIHAYAQRSVPLGRLGAPDEFAALAAFLLSDDARWITGAIYPFDGGATAA